MHSDSAAAIIIQKDRAAAGSENAGLSAGGRAVEAGSSPPRDWVPAGDGDGGGEAVAG